MEVASSSAIGGPAAPLLVDIELARRIEAALTADLCTFADALARLDPALGARWRPIGGGAAVFTGPLGTRAQGIGLDGPVDDAVLDELDAFFAERARPTELELCPLADPGLFDELGRRGARLHGFRDVCALIDPSTPLQPSVPGLVIRGATDPDEVAVWSAVVLDGFEVSDPAERTVFARWNTMMATVANATLLVAFLDGVAVGGSNVVVHDLPGGPVASLGGTATLPARRHQGVQLALLRERLRIAASAGCSLAVVTADPGSSSGRNARRAGFTLAYTNVRLRTDRAG